MLKSSATSSGELVNETLRSALAHKGLDQLSLASALQVDPKTVERWLAGRTPHPRSRRTIAELLGRPEVELWPNTATNRDGRTSRFGPEIRAVYPHRYAVPRQVWYDLFLGAEHEIDILVYSGLFLFEDSGIMQLLAEKAQAGVRIRLLLGDPISPEVAQRGEDEDIGESTAARINKALALLHPFACVNIRLHRNILYSVICRSDHRFLVSPQIFGVAASAAPVLEVAGCKRGGVVDIYVNCLGEIWRIARPWGLAQRGSTEAARIEKGHLG
jgi:transcriptional regulator with XRE-family HTH domain